MTILFHKTNIGKADFERELVKHYKLEMLFKTKLDDATYYYLKNVFFDFSNADRHIGTWYKGEGCIYQVEV